jgi:hypothetical protein
MKHSHRALIAFVFALAPLSASADHEEVLLFPMGQLVALPILAIALWRASILGAVARVVIAVGALSIAAALWFVPGPKPSTGIGIFLLGLLPPVAFVAICIAIRRALPKKRATDA